MHAHTIETTTTRTRRASRRGSPTDSAVCGRPTTGRGLTVSASPTSNMSSSLPQRRTIPGLCAASAAVRRRFASDLDNLTLATPDLNRYRKRDHDAAEWLPERNRCWFAATIVAVRREYGPDHRPERSGGPR